MQNAVVRVALDPKSQRHRLFFVKFDINYLFYLLPEYNIEKLE